MCWSYVKQSLLVVMLGGLCSGVQAQAGAVRGASINALAACGKTPNIEH